MYFMPNVNSIGDLGVVVGQTGHRKARTEAPVGTRTYIIINSPVGSALCKR